MRAVNNTMHKKDFRNFSRHPYVGRTARSSLRYHDFLVVNFSIKYAYEQRNDTYLFCCLTSFVCHCHYRRWAAADCNFCRRQCKKLEIVVVDESLIWLLILRPSTCVKYRLLSSLMWLLFPPPSTYKKPEIVVVDETLIWLLILRPSTLSLIHIWRCRRRG